MTRKSKLTACILIAIGVHAAIFAATDVGLRAANNVLRSFGPADQDSSPTSTKTITAMPPSPRNNPYSEFRCSNTRSSRSRSSSTPPPDLDFDNPL